MSTRESLAAVVAVACLLCGQASADDYANGFEAKDDSSFWTAGLPRVFGLKAATESGYLVVHSQGLSEQEAWSGDKSLRLDVTLKAKGA